MLGQSKIIGYVHNNEISLSSVNIILEDQNSKNILLSTSTDKTGNFEISFQSKGKFNLVILALLYESKTIPVEITNNNSTIKIDILLIGKINEIEEVVIQQPRSIVEKKDTIIFNAKSFLQGNEQTVEDLLRKIPGLNIDANGTIKVGNQEVEKVMVDGDDFFEKGYKILTKNMPVSPIDKVQLLQKYSNNKLLKGIENSNKVALNLTLKADAKNIWFGNLLGGYDVTGNKRYTAKANVMNFGKKNKFYFLATGNNIGSDPVGDLNELIRPYRTDEPGSIGDDESANTLLGLGFDLPNLKEKRVNFNNAKLLSLNSIFTLSKKVKLKALGFLNSDSNDFYRNSFQYFSVSNTNFINTENFAGNKKQFTGFGKIDLNYDISKTKTFEYTGKFNKTDEKSNSDLLFNGDLLNEKLNSDNQLIDQKVVYTDKVTENKVFLLSARYINEKTPQNYSVNQFLFSDLFNTTATNTKQFSQNKMQYAGMEAHLLDKKKNGDLLEIKIGNQFRLDNLNTQFEIFENETRQNLPPDYQNNLTYTTNDLYLSTKYRFKLKNISLLAQGDAHQLFNQIDNSGIKTNQNPFFIVPKIGMDWEINGKNKIITSYTYNTTNAKVFDIYTGFVQTGFNSLSKGLGEFNQLNSSNAFLNYTYGNWGDKFFANTFINYTKNNDFYSTNSLITQNFSQSEKILIKDREFLAISANLDRYFKPIKSNLKVIIGASKTNFKNIVNNSDLREVKNLNINYGLELRSGFKGFFNYHIGTKWNFNEVKTTTSKSFTDNLTFLDLSLIFSNKFNIQLQSERYFFGNLEKGSNQYYFLDAEVRYVIKENKLTLFLSGNNLFNVNTFKNYSITDVAISKTEYRLQPRYLMLKLEYRF